MTAIVLTLLLTPAAQISSSAPGGAVTPSGDSGAQRLVVVPRVAGAVQGSGEVGGGYARSVTGSVGAGSSSRGGAAVNPRGPVTAKQALGTSPERCPDYRRGLAWYRGRYLSHRAKMGAGSSRAHRQGERASCPHVRYLASRWRTKAHAARRAYERWAAVHVLRDPEVRPGNSAWHRAVQEAQRAYPGTRGWLLSCSASEGGWGRWVPNSQGSGVGGWMQMYPSTFARMFGAARIDLARRAFIVPATANSWHSPLGQALASAWGLKNGRRHEWAGYGC